MKFQLTRRKLIKSSLKMAALLPVMGIASCQNNPEKSETTPGKALNILILGGTSFLGPHQIAFAISRGHKITTFTRGRTRPTIHQDLFDQVNMLTGDRNSDISALESGTWDVVIDNSGHKVEWTKNSAELLKDKCKMYVYTSSTGVYYPYLTDQIDENTIPLLTEPENVEDEDMKIEYWYGVMKANSELQAINSFGKERTLIIRPTYMIGPADKSNRFIHWPVRLASGGDVLVPGKKSDPVQYMDVRDVAEFIIRMIEKNASGVFNVVGPDNAQSIYEFVISASSAFDQNHKLVLIDDYTFLKNQGIKDVVPWILPEGNNYASARIHGTKAKQAGLQFRPLVNTVRDTFEWWNSESVPQEFRDKYLSDAQSVLAREKSILNEWNNRLSE